MTNDTINGWNLWKYIQLPPLLTCESLSNGWHYPDKIASQEATHSPSDISLTLTLQCGIDVLLLFQVDQFVTTNLLSTTMSASDSETKSDNIIFNVTKHPEQGFLVHLNDESKPVNSFYQKVKMQLQHFVLFFDEKHELLLYTTMNTCHHLVHLKRLACPVPILITRYLFIYWWSRKLCFWINIYMYVRTVRYIWLGSLWRYKIA